MEKLYISTDAKPKLASKSTKLASKVVKLASENADFASKVAELASNAPKWRKKAVIIRRIRTEFES
ncbi:hypothetical protein ACQKGI_08255 [Peribacillus muralis]|uniref:hypothetical protein n=1 Tax=Peribacillus muralis TaxID=264697 RepID=UPI003812BE81